MCQHSGRSCVDIIFLLKIFIKFIIAIPQIKKKWIKEVLVTQGWSTLWDAMDYSPPGSSVYEIL